MKFSRSSVIGPLLLALALVAVAGRALPSRAERAKAPRAAVAALAMPGPAPAVAAGRSGADAVRPGTSGARGFPAPARPAGCDRPLAAARDGSVSACSSGVPPPAV